MALSFFGRCCLGLALMGAADLDYVGSQRGYKLTKERIELLHEKIVQLDEKVDKNAEEMKHQFDSKIVQLYENMDKTAEEMKQHFDNKLANLVEDMRRNYESIKDSTSEISSSVSLCRMTDGHLACRKSSLGAEWIVVQQRFDGSVDFNRNWNDYRRGFGTVGANSEFWWGLERLHQHTKDGQYELLLEFEDGKGEYRFARYSDFVVEGESEKYRLAKLGGYSGTAGDINDYGHKFWVPTGQKFTTYDSDNDNYPDGNCASPGDMGGGWWFNWCGYGLNSKWSSYIRWSSWKDKPLHYTRMLIRAKV